MKKVLSIFTALAILLGASSFSESAHAAVSFKDVKGNWAEETIDWGARHGVSTGYPDGTFKPNGKVSEAEFLKFLVSYYKDTVLTNMKPGAHWSEKYYEFAYRSNYPVKGANDLKIRNSPITRQTVADILIGALYGKNYTGFDSVKYLMAKGVLKGKDQGKYTAASFRGQDTLTRAEAMQIIRNVYDAAERQLWARPKLPSSQSEMVEFVPERIAMLEAGKNEVVKQVKTLDPDLGIYNNAKDAIFVFRDEGKSIAFLKFEDGQRDKGYVTLMEDGRDDPARFEVMVALARAAGLDANESLINDIKTVLKTRNEITMVIGDKQVHLLPHETDAASMWISFGFE